MLNGVKFSSCRLGPETFVQIYCSLKTILKIQMLKNVFSSYYSKMNISDSDFSKISFYDHITLHILLYKMQKTFQSHAVWIPN